MLFALASGAALVNSTGTSLVLATAFDCSDLKPLAKTTDRVAALKTNSCGRRFS